VKRPVAALAAVAGFAIGVWSWVGVALPTRWFNLYFAVWEPVVHNPIYDFVSSSPFTLWLVALVFGALLAWAAWHYAIRVWTDLASYYQGKDKS
jgi:hypothetical protein